MFIDGVLRGWTNLHCKRLDGKYFRLHGVCGVQGSRVGCYSLKAITDRPYLNERGSVPKKTVVTETGSIGLLVTGSQALT